MKDLKSRPRSWDEMASSEWPFMVSLATVKALIRPPWYRRLVDLLRRPWQPRPEASVPVASYRAAAAAPRLPVGCHLDRVAAKQLQACPISVQRRVVASLERLEANPRPRGVAQVKGADDQLRIRVGDYRVIYTVDSELLPHIRVRRVMHRRDVYGHAD